MNTIKVLNSCPLRLVGPDLGPNYLQRLSADDASRQRVNILQTVALYETEQIKNIFTSKHKYRQIKNQSILVMLVVHKHLASLLRWNTYIFLYW